MLELSSFDNEWIDPAAGDGAIIEAVDAYRDDIHWTAVDIRDTRADLQSIGLSLSQIEIGDFLEMEFEKRFDVAIFNPPFTFLMEFIAKCRQIARISIAFQTLNLLGSDERHEWLSGDFPDVYVIPNRVAHKGNGRSDSVYSAWYVWGEERKDRGTIRLLDLSSKEERADCNERLICSTDEKARVLRSLFEVIE
jgi:hypothetical protein